MVMKGRYSTFFSSSEFIRSLQVHDPARYQEATQLIERHVRIGLRTLDAIQLAVALALSHQGVIDQFVCADQRLCDTAIEEGLSVTNPRDQ
jgi:predicted nucleic acid-binding protein